MSDKIAVINHGKVQQYDEPKIVFQKPSNIFVAQFIGTPSMNLIPVEIVEEHSQIVVQAPTFALPVSKEKTILLKERNFTKKAVLGIRSQIINLMIEQKGAIASGKTIFKELIGTEWIIHVEVGGVLLRVVTKNSMKEISDDNKIYIGFEPSEVHLFDESTGEIIVHGL